MQEVLEDAARCAHGRVFEPLVLDSRPSSNVALLPFNISRTGTRGYSESVGQNGVTLDPSSQKAGDFRMK